MGQSFRTVFLLTLLVTAIASTALARMVVGVTPATLPGVADRGALASLQEELQKRSGEAVQVRSFDSEKAQLDWLIRFRELDAALVSRSLPKTLAPGTLIPLAEFSGTVAVTHSGISSARANTLREAFRSLGDDDRGRQLLHRLTGGIKSEQPSPATAPKSAPAPAPVAAATPRPAVSLQAAPAVTPPKPAEPAIRPVPAAPPAATSAPPVKAPAPPAQPTASPVPAETQPVAPSVSKPAAAPIIRTPPVAAKPLTAKTPAVSEPAAPAPKPEPAPRNRTGLFLLAALVLLTGIVIKVTLLARHWRQRQNRQHTPPPPPAVEKLDLSSVEARPFDFNSTSFAPPSPATIATPPATDVMETIAPSPAVTGETPAVAGSGKSATARRKSAQARKAEELFTPEEEKTAIERGRLGKTKTPALLTRCAELPQPTILRVRTPDNEICVHFAGGQICHAYSRDWRSEDDTRQWSKLGYLIVREGLLSEAQCDSMLETLGKQQGLRLGTALQKEGLLDLEALRHILTRQAKIVLYCLILFPEGEYLVEPDSGEIPAEESIALQVEALIREAAHHQAEWTAIRKVLPKLNTVLGFCTDGHDKLEQVRLSVHQHLLLSQVDSRNPVGKLCSDSTMMDYEACRFLYLMVKAGVLEVVPAA